MKNIKYIGLDVHKETISIALISGNNYKPDFEKTISSNKKKVKDFFIIQGNPENIICCYEAGCTGFGLQRVLDSMGITRHSTVNSKKII